MTPIILASKSPRRKELMTLLDIPFTVQTEDVEEIIREDLSPEENVCQLAYEKAKAVSKVYPHEWIIGCDTMVAYENKLLGKPSDAEDAKEMLRFLSDRIHQVYTGMSIQNHEMQVSIQFYVCSQVKMKKLSEEEITWYVGTKEPLDKAGSYGIQGKGSVFIEGIEGDYFNIVGLPIARLYDELKKLYLISH